MIEITKENIETQVEEIALKYGISKSTARKWIKHIQTSQYGQKVAETKRQELKMALLTFIRQNRSVVSHKNVVKTLEELKGYFQ